MQLPMEPTMTGDQGATAYARIIAFENGRATLAAERKTACQSCAAAKGCSVPALARALGEKPLTFETDEIAAPRVGDWYQIVLPQSAILKLAAIAYLLPLAGLITMALAATMAGAGDGGAVIAGLAGLFAGHRSASLIAASPRISRLANPVVTGKSNAGTGETAACIGMD